MQTPPLHPLDAKALAWMKGSLFPFFTKYYPLFVWLICYSGIYYTFYNTPYVYFFTYSQNDFAIMISIIFASGTYIGYWMGQYGKKKE